ncbi:hypothetical protein CO026_01625 [Candidatus Kaiserbacteria bacterium CG_4_9_14_0_2_um_filter_41_32]|uniref:Uncharacterized protein n=1 Tax=Candidatus Kaiserbacteria bacterium CG_4_9_14_0_2_um_filter_41_32 TaxID=1974601 RepID=A0A2M8FF01_9BACT|nr:MAG: hypothetical protein CO026_01625 [Candidatus Kaiserbacteria bacterium CG_4_9_14_0_2_um_filter_41_32]
MMKKPKNKLIIVFSLIFALFVINTFILSPAVASAQTKGGLVPCGGYEADGVTRERPCNVADIFVLIARVTNWLIMAAGIYAVFQIIVAGWWLAASVGNEEAITKHKNAITQALVGLVLVLCAYMFVNTAVNIIFLRGIEGCTIDLTDPLSYVKIDQSQCPQIK